MTQPKHEIDGFKAGSSGYRHGCRCDQCKTSNTGYQRKHRTRTRSVEASRVVRGQVAERIQRVNPVIPEPVVISFVQPEPPVITRDETIPGQIMTALGYQDSVSYVDGGEGWALTELAMYLQATENVECVIQDDVLYVTAREEQSYASVQTDLTGIPNPPRALPAVAGNPARPRIVAMGSAPTVPSTPQRTANR